MNSCTNVFANVIKIEMPGKGDDTRAMGPKKNDYSMYYAYVNRGKKGITLNLKSEEGKKLFLEMVKKADVVVENYRPGVMDKLGVGSGQVQNGNITQCFFHGNISFIR